MITITTGFDKLDYTFFLRISLSVLSNSDKSLTKTEDDISNYLLDNSVYMIRYEIDNINIKKNYFKNFSVISDSVKDYKLKKYKYSNSSVIRKFDSDDNYVKSTGQIPFDPSNMRITPESLKGTNNDGLLGAFITLCQSVVNIRSAVCEIANGSPFLMTLGSIFDQMDTQCGDVSKLYDVMQNKDNPAFLDLMVLIMQHTNTSALFQFSEESAIRKYIPIQITEKNRNMSNALNDYCTKKKPLSMPDFLWIHVTPVMNVQQRNINFSRKIIVKTVKAAFLLVFDKHTSIQLFFRILFNREHKYRYKFRMRT